MNTDDIKFAQDMILNIEENHAVPKDRRYIEKTKQYRSQNRNIHLTHTILAVSISINTSCIHESYHLPKAIMPVPFQISVSIHDITKFHKINTSKDAYIQSYISEFMFEL